MDRVVSERIHVEKPFLDWHEIRARDRRFSWLPRSLHGRRSRHLGRGRLYTTGGEIVHQAGLELSMLGESLLLNRRRPAGVVEPLRDTLLFVWRRRRRRHCVDESDAQRGDARVRIRPPFDASQAREYLLIADEGIDWQATRVKRDLFLPRLIRDVPGSIACLRNHAA